MRTENGSSTNGIFVKIRWIFMNFEVWLCIGLEEWAQYKSFNGGSIRIVYFEYTRTPSQYDFDTITSVSKHINLIKTMILYVWTQFTNNNSNNDGDGNGDDDDDNDNDAKNNTTTVKRKQTSPVTRRCLF